MSPPAVDWAKHRAAPLAMILLLAATGCEEEVMGPGDNPGATEAAPAATATASAAVDDKPTIPVVEFTETDFVESEESRDPFRDYSYLFVKRSQGESVVQRKVKASDFALDELKLVAILTRGRPSIMLTDSTGFGWVLYVGDFVGRPELVSAGGTDGAEVAINWRVDRIRSTDVVFIREDSAHPDIPPTTRVIPLYPTGEGT
ncbi:MAG: pilus assembly protein PilP [Polyangiaceae bacterium]